MLAFENRSLRTVRQFSRNSRISRNSRKWAEVGPEFFQERSGKNFRLRTQVLVAIESRAKSQQPAAHQGREVWFVEWIYDGTVTSSRLDFSSYFRDPKEQTEGMTGSANAVVIWYESTTLFLSFLLRACSSFKMRKK
jgi:hypothetical protein